MYKQLHLTVKTRQTAASTCAGHRFPKCPMVREAKLLTFKIKNISIHPANYGRFPFSYYSYKSKFSIGENRKSLPSSAFAGVCLL